uniref:ABC transporter permease n=1 Tax=Geotalea sp. SG265 TaxID=2922867 RepID=UPI001FAF2A05
MRTVMRSKSGGITSKYIAVGATILLFVGICLLPVIYMFAFSFVDASGHFSIANYQRLFMDERQRALLLNSGILGAGATAVAMTIGIPLGIILARSDMRAKRLIRLLLIIPLAIPSFILALAWIYIGGTAGLAAQVTGADFLSPFTYSLTGAMVVIGLNLFPLAMLATESAAWRVEGHLEEAAMLVATSNRVFWRITIPLISPNIAAAALIIFVLAISEFAVPSLLRVPVFTSEIFTAFAALYEFGAATALAIPLLIMALVSGLGVKMLVGDRIVSTRRSSGTLFLQWHGPRRFIGILWLLVVLLVSVLLPLAVLAREAGGMEPVVAAIGGSSGAIINSLSLAVVGAVLIALIAAMLGYGAARSSGRIHDFADIAFLVTFAVPGTVVGIGLINIWNRPGLPSIVYQSLFIILVAYIRALKNPRIEQLCPLKGPNSISYLFGLLNLCSLKLNFAGLASH